MTEAGVAIAEARCWLEETRETRSAADAWSKGTAAAWRQLIVNTEERRPNLTDIIKI